jgi:MFS family permease
MDSTSNEPRHRDSPFTLAPLLRLDDLAVAAAAMVGTLPGRTQGLGLVTEPLLKDLNIDRILFAHINLWATLIGALFALGVGRLTDRFGSRVLLTSVSTALGVVVLAMSGVNGVIAIALLITLTRGLGQSALSVISITIVGQWFVRRLNLAMSVYTILLSVGFMAAFPIVGAVVVASGWRVAWAGIGVALLVVLAPAAWLVVRRSPEACSLTLDGGSPADAEPVDVTNDYALRAAISTPAFWVFALSSAVYGLIASGIALFNESILTERGFRSSHISSKPGADRVNRTCRQLPWWLADSQMVDQQTHGPGNGMLACSLLALPHVTTQLHVVLYALVMGLAGGFVIVIFFSFWSQAFGRTNLGKIQGAAQALTVVASAIGPLILAECVSRTGSYAAVFYVMAVVVVVLGLCAWFVRLPRRMAAQRA